MVPLPPPCPFSSPWTCQETHTTPRSTQNPAHLTPSIKPDSNQNPLNPPHPKKSLLPFYRSLRPAIPQLTQTDLNRLNQA
jgi:hypothetical protein